MPVLKFLKKYRVALIILVLGIAILSFPFWQIYPYFAAGSSSAKLSLVGQTMVAEFTWSETDKSRLSEVARKINIPWSGENFAFSLSPDAVDRVRSHLPVTVGLSAPSNTEFDLSMSEDFLPVGKIGAAGSEAEFIPASALSVVRSAGLGSLYDLPGKEVFKYTDTTSTLAALYSGDKLGLILQSKIKDSEGLNKTLAGLKNIEVTSNKGYSSSEAASIGFSEAVVEGIKTYTLTDPDISYQPTFGVIGDHLVAATSPDFWQMAKKAFDSKGSITEQSRYKESFQGMPAVNVGSFYIDMKGWSGRGDKAVDNLKQFSQFSISPNFLSYNLDLGRIKTISGEWLGLNLDQSKTDSKLLLRVVAP